jgi:hypothetical protein
MCGPTEGFLLPIDLPRHFWVFSIGDYGGLKAADGGISQVLSLLTDMARFNINPGIHPNLEVVVRLIEGLGRAGATDKVDYLYSVAQNILSLLHKDGNVGRLGDNQKLYDHCKWACR